MDAIAYLTEQHQEISSLFDQLESAARTKTKLRLCQLETIGARLASVADQLMGPGVVARERITARRALA